MPKTGIKVYLLGNLEVKNFAEKLAVAEDSLTRQGYDVFNPAKTPKQKGWSWIDSLAYRLQMLENCNEILCLANCFVENRTADDEIYYSWASGECNIIFLAAQRLGITVLADELYGKGGHK